jgi:hypothetical protein
MVSGVHGERFCERKSEDLSYITNIASELAISVFGIVASIVYDQITGLVHHLVSTSICTTKHRSTYKYI